MVKHFLLIIKLLLVVILFAILSTILMIAVYKLPTDNMVENAKDFKEYLSISNWDGEFVYSQADSFTDSMMINIAIIAPYKSDIDNALLNPFYYSDDDIAGPYYQLYDYIDNEGYLNNNDTFINYGRYWHGYLLYLKPLLLLFTLSEIRWFFYLIEFSLVILTEIILAKKDFRLAAFFGIVILFICPITTVLSMANANAIIIMLIVNLIVVIWTKELVNNNKYIYLFLISGMLTTFLDIASCPVVPLGISLATFIALSDFQGVGKKTICVINSAISYGFGYVTFWASKWFMISLFTNIDPFEEVKNAFIYRTVGDSSSLFSGIKANLLAIYNKPMLVLLFIFAFMILFFITSGKYNSVGITSVIPLLIISLFPFIWYFIVCEHSVVHPFLEYRHIAISIWAIGCITTELFSYRKRHVFATL